VAGLQIPHSFSFVSEFMDLFRVGQNRIFTLYMNICMAIFLPKIPYIHHIYIPINVWFWPNLDLLLDWQSQADQPNCLAEGPHVAQTKSSLSMTGWKINDRVESID